jgi:hypothetical protein
VIYTAKDHGYADRIFRNFHDSTVSKPGQLPLKSLLDILYKVRKGLLYTEDMPVRLCPSISAYTVGQIWCERLLLKFDKHFLFAPLLVDNKA